MWRQLVVGSPWQQVLQQVLQQVHVRLVEGMSEHTASGQGPAAASPEHVPLLEGSIECPALSKVSDSGAAQTHACLHAWYT